MDLRQLLGKLTVIEGTMTSAEKHPTGPKFTGKWKGTDKGTPGTKLVGDSIEPEESILKDLSKGPTPKTKEQELAEQFEQFLSQLEEDNLGVEEKRPTRKGSRPQREYEKTGQPSKRYNYKKDETDESRGHKIVARKLKDIEAQGKPVSDEEYAKHIERMKQAKKEYLKKNPNSIYKQEVDEAVPVPPTPPKPPTPPGVQQPPVAGQEATQADKQAVAAAMQGSMAIKAATGASASAPNLLKALDTATQGKPLPATDAKMLEPVLGVIGQVAKDPKLAGQFKTLASQAQQSAQQQQNQQKK